MSEPRIWPAGAPGALSLTFDNLGEAAEVQLGAKPLPSGRGEHFTATRVLPSLLPKLDAHGLRATFFVEGVNTMLYPEALQAIALSGHEVAYHAWCHEDWAGLSAEEQGENLARGIAGFDRLDLSAAGMRPPGGLLGDGGLEVLREAGLRYASPAGEGAGEQAGIALLPFQWRHVDVASLLPPLAAVRERMTGSSEPLEPPAFVAALERSLDELAEAGGYLSIVLHLTMLEWLGEDRLDTLLGRLAELADGELWVAPCEEVATRVLATPAAFRGGTVLDSASWTAN